MISRPQFVRSERLSALKEMQTGRNFYGLPFGKTRVLTKKARLLCLSRQLSNVRVCGRMPCATLPATIIVVEGWRILFVLCQRETLPSSFPKTPTLLGHENSLLVWSLHTFRVFIRQKTPAKLFAKSGCTHRPSRRQLLAVLARLVPPRKHHRVLLYVPRPDLDADRHTLRAEARLQQIEKSAWVNPSLS